MNRWIQAAASLLYPHNCAICVLALPEDETGWLCAGCLRGVDWIRPPCCHRCSAPFEGDITHPFECSHCAGMVYHFEVAHAACRAQGVVRECIHRLKYERQVYLDRHLADWLAEGVMDRVRWEDVDAFVPVPLFPRREREREFNQAELIANELSRRFQKPCWPRVLRRVRDTRSQTRLDRRAREQNVRGAFLAQHAETLQGRGVALVDDVFTTGATASECARVLKAAGAKLVIVLTVARG